MKTIIRVICIFLTLLMVLSSCQPKNGNTSNDDKLPSGDGTISPPAYEDVDYNAKIYVGDELVDITKIPQLIKLDNSSNELMDYSISVTNFASLEFFIDYREPVIVKISVSDYGIQNGENTVTKCKVEEIYFGNEDNLVNLGAEITVQTPYYVGENNGERCFWVNSGFRFLRKGESYVACLIPQKDTLNFSPILNAYFELSDSDERQTMRELFPICSWEIDEIREKFIDQYVSAVNYNTKLLNVTDSWLFPINIATLTQKANPGNPLVDRAFVNDFTTLDRYISLSNAVIVKMKVKSHGIQLEKETFTTCTIEEIYFGNEDNILAIGNDLAVETPYYIDYVDGEKCFFADSEYRFLRKGQSYVACIYPNENDSKFSLVPNGYFELSEPEVRQAVYELLPYCGKENSEIRDKFFEKYVTAN